MTTDTPAAPAGVRNATLADIAALLRDQQALKSDFVVPAAAIRARSGRLVIDDSAPVLGPDGVTLTAGMYTPTGVCDQGIADKLGIPGTYLRRMREQRPDLYDANVNGWLEGDGRKFLLRCLRAGGPAGKGIARAFLSDGYKFIDLSRSWDYPDGWVASRVRSDEGGPRMVAGVRGVGVITGSPGRRASGRAAGIVLVWPTAA